MRKATNRLTKNGKRRGRPPLYLSVTQIEAPLGARRAPGTGKSPLVHRRRIGPLRLSEHFAPRPSTTTLLIVQREVAKRGAKFHTKQEIAALTALRVMGVENERNREITARRLRRI